MSGQPQGTDFSWLTDPNSKVPFNVPAFDDIVTKFYSGQGDKQSQQAHELLAQFQQNPKAYFHTTQIINNAQSMNSKMMALSVLQHTIQVQWNVLPPDQKLGMRKFVEELIINLSKHPKYESLGAFVVKLNAVLIEIVKREWPHNWPNFISQVIEVSKKSPAVCTNSMKLLSLLCQDAAENVGDLTHEEQVKLQQNLNKEFSAVFQLCIYVFKNAANNDRLLTETLRTFHNFLRLSWIPTKVIMESDIIEMLSMKFYGNIKFRNLTLECLIEIINVKDASSNPKYVQKIVCLFIKVFECTFKQYNLRLDSNISQFIGSGGGNRTFAQHFCNFLIAMLKSHHVSLEKHSDSSRESLKAALHFIGAFTDVEDTTLFSICVEYWELLSRKLKQRFGSKHSNSLLLSSSLATGSTINDQLYTSVYSPTLHNLKFVLMRRLPRPKEVLVMEDELGNIVKHEMKDTFSLTLHKQISDILRQLSSLDPTDTRKVIGENLDKFDKNSQQINFKQLESLCWSIGSVAGSMSPEVEKSFLVIVIKILLSLCEVQKTKNAKAIIASCIMYVVRKYPRFLKKHWKFLQTVVRKLIEFLHEKHPGVQDMSVETLEEICEQCGEKFIKIQENDRRIFLKELIEGMHSTMCKDLDKEQIENLYRVWGRVIAKEKNSSHNHTEMKYPELISKLLKQPNDNWRAIMNAAAAANSSSILMQQQTILMILHILRINKSVANAVGQKFLLQMQCMYNDLINLYKFYADKTKEFSKEMRNNGPNSSNNAELGQMIRAMCTVKSEILQLFEKFVSAANKNDYPLLVEKFIPRFLGIVLEDYKTSPDNIRIAACLGTCAALIESIGIGMSKYIGAIFNAVFPSTVGMIRGNMTDWPDHRRNYFRLLKASSVKCFNAFKELKSDDFKLFMKSLCYGIEHYDTIICESSLCALTSIVSHISNNKQDCTLFYQNQIGNILLKLVHVLTDTLHKSFTDKLSVTLLQIFSQVANENKCGQLYDPKKGYKNNFDFIGRSLVRELKGQHAAWDDQVIFVFISGLIASGKEYSALVESKTGFNNSNATKAIMEKNKTLCNDFLVQLKQMHGPKGNGNNNANNNGGNGNNNNSNNNSINNGASSGVAVNNGSNMNGNTNQQ